MLRLYNSYPAKQFALIHRASVAEWSRSHPCSGGFF